MTDLKHKVSPLRFAPVGMTDLKHKVSTVRFAPVGMTGELGLGKFADGGRGNAGEGARATKSKIGGSWGRTLGGEGHCRIRAIDSGSNADDSGVGFSLGGKTRGWLFLVKQIEHRVESVLEFVVALRRAERHNPEKVNRISVDLKPIRQSLIFTDDRGHEGHGV